MHFFIAIAFLAITSTAFFLLSSSRTQADITAPDNITAQAVITAQSLIADGEDAIDMLGQYDDSSLVDPVVDYNKTGKNNGPSKLGFDNAAGMALDAVHHRLFVADQGNDRVLVYNLNTNNTLADRIPDYVLGQTNFQTKTLTNLTQSGLSQPISLAYDPVNDRLFVGQYQIHRISVFDVSTITNGENAMNILGQFLFTTSSPSVNPAAKTIYPTGLAFDSVNQRLFVAQEGYNRVTIFDVTTITDGEDAINVLGQADFTTLAAATTQAGLYTPYGLAYDEARQLLFITDSFNRRVIVQDVNTATISNGQNASYVLGEPLFTTRTNTSGSGGLTSAKAVTYDSTGQRLFVGQVGTVYVFDVSTITNGEAAINILGNTTYADTSGNVSISGMSFIAGTVYDEVNDYLYVSQGTSTNPGIGDANRVSVFDVASITNGENAIDLLGQDDGTSLTDPVIDFTKGGANNAPNNLGFNIVSDVELDTIHHRLFVADSLNDRVLVYNLETDNSLSDRIPDYILGQSTFTTQTTVSSVSTQSNIYRPKGLAYDGNNDRLFVTDTRQRIMVYDVSTITNGENAVNVLGQTTFTTATYGTTQVNLWGPNGIDYDESEDRLFVVDYVNYRVLIYDVDPLTMSNGKAASNVLGQPDFTTRNLSQLTQSGLYYPEDVAYDAVNKRLFIAEKLGSRVIVYDLTNIQDGEDAVNVLGQINFTSKTLTTTATGLYQPAGVAFDEVNNRLFVGDLSNNSSTGSRVVVYDTAVITNGEAATNVIGKSNLNTTDGSDLNAAAKIYTAQKLALDMDGNHLFVAQGSYGNRISVFDIGQAGFLIEETEGSTNVTEGGTDIFTVVLTAEPPTGDVVFAVSSNQPTSANISASTLTFTSANWNVPQTITVTAPEDNNALNETATLTVSINTASTDDAFDALPNQTVSVAVTDNDMAGITLTESDGTTAAIEGETDSYTLALTSEPTSDVIIDITVDDQVFVDSAVLTFTAVNWNIPQTVTVTAFDNTITDGEHTGTINHTVSSADLDYDGLAVSDVVMTITDNDHAGGTTYYGGPIVVTPTSCTITSPNGGETWQAGSSHDITWTTAGIGINNLVLYYRVDVNDAWTTIYAGTQNDGSFSWTLPDVSSQNMSIKADCRDSGAATLASDMSDDVFEIIAEPFVGPKVPEVISPDREKANLLLPPGYPVDSLVKLADDGDDTTQVDSAVYYLGLDGMRHPFPNVQIFFSWYRDFSLVRTIDASTLASIPLGSSILTRPGTYWVKIQSDPKTYYVSPGYVLNWIQDETTAALLGGDNWNQQIVDINQAFFSRFTVGNSISVQDLATSWPEGSLVREKGTSGLYYVDTDGVRPVSAAGLLVNHFQEKFVDYTSANAGWKSLPITSDITIFEDGLFSELAI